MLPKPLKMILIGSTSAVAGAVVVTAAITFLFLSLAPGRLAQTVCELTL